MRGLSKQEKLCIKAPPQCHLLSNEWIPVQPWGFAQQSTQTRVLEGVMLSGWCWMKSCCPCALLLPSSASDMRWHSSPSRDALEVTVCLGEIIKKNQSKKPTKQNKKSSNAWKMSRDYCKSCFGDVWCLGSAGCLWLWQEWIICRVHLAELSLSYRMVLSLISLWFPHGFEAGMVSAAAHVLLYEQHNAPTSLPQLLLQGEFGQNCTSLTPSVLPHQNQGSSSLVNSKNTQLN